MMLHLLLMSSEVKFSNCVRLTVNCLLSSKLRKLSLLQLPCTIAVITLHEKNISWFSVSAADCIVPQETHRGVGQEIFTSSDSESWYCFPRVCCTLSVCSVRVNKLRSGSDSVDRHISGCGYFGSCLYVCCSV